MSFVFGNSADPAGATGFSFGAAAPSSGAAVTPSFGLQTSGSTFNFGATAAPLAAPAAAPAPAASAFTFGAAPTSTAAATSVGAFSFGAIGRITKKVKEV